MSLTEKKEEKKAPHRKEEKTSAEAEKKKKKPEKPAKDKEGSTEQKTKEKKKPAEKQDFAEGSPEEENKLETKEEYLETEKKANKKKKKPKKEEKKLSKLSPKEVEETIVSLANAGHTASEIGLQLKQSYGIQKTKKILKKTISEILKEHNLLGEVPEDLLSLIRKSVLIKKHMEKNKKDMSAKRGYQLTVSKIRRLAKYHAESGRLPAGWRYSEETAELLVK